MTIDHYKSPIINSYLWRRIKVKGGKDLVWLKYFVIGTELAFSVISGLILGHFVDKWIGTKTPWFTFIGLIGGVVAGFGLLMSIIKRKNDDGNETDKGTEIR